MACYEIKISLSGCTKPAPMVRVWLDPDVNVGSVAEVELPLCRQTDMQWSAAFLLAPPKTFLYRVGLYAEPGSIWSISICQRGACCREVFFDSDMLALPKQWLLGTYTAA